MLNIQANLNNWIHEIDLSWYKFQRKDIWDQIISIIWDYLNNNNTDSSKNDNSTSKELTKEKPIITIEQQKINDKVQKEINDINLKWIFALSSSHDALKLINDFKNN